jgi:hypothetical protein
VKEVSQNCPVMHDMVNRTLHQSKMTKARRRGKERRKPIAAIKAVGYRLSLH